MYIIVYNNRNLLRKLEVKKIVCVHKTRVHLFCFPTRRQPRTTTDADVLFFYLSGGGEKMKNYEIGLTGKKPTKPPLRE